MRLHASFSNDFTEDTYYNDLSLEKLIQPVVLEFCLYRIKLLVLLIFRQIIL